jgi:hypothetical protein
MQVDGFVLADHRWLARGAGKVRLFSGGFQAIVER